MQVIINLHLRMYNILRTCSILRIFIYFVVKENNSNNNKNGGKKDRK